MKRILMSLTAAILCFAAIGIGGCARSSAVKTATLDGVTVTLTDADIQRNRKNGRTVIQTTVRISNDSADSIMVVDYELVCLDRDGNELYVCCVSYNGQDRALMPGESTVHEKGFSKTLDGTVKAVGIRVTETKTDGEVPPLHLPVTGEFLYEAINSEQLNNIRSEPPVRIVVGIDQGGSLREAMFTDPDDLTKATELFLAIRIGQQTDTFVTDNYNYIIFTWADGSETRISLNKVDLEVSIYNNLHYYELEGIQDFWSFANSAAEGA